MDPENYKLRSYAELPIVPSNDFQELVKTRHLVLHYNLIVDYEGFNHPGYFNTIEQFRGKQIQDAYIQREHSFNSDLILCHKTIGRLEKSPLEEQGRSFYNKIKDSDLNIRHQKILSKFDFSQPIYESMKHLSFEEINTLTEVPKFLKNPYSVKIAKDGQVTPKGWTGIETQFMLESNLYFGSYMAVALGILFYNFTLMDILKNSYFSIFGYIFWCFLEYMIHRYRLHHNMLQTHKVKGGDMHHMFPNHPGALSIGDVNPYLAIMLSPLYFIISPVQFTLVVIGVISGLLFYNIIHYNCHLGPEVNIGWFRALRTHHMKHHFRDQHSRYGISATIMDHIFSTMTPKEKSK